MSLKRAQQLAQRKRTAEALQVLLPLCRAEPDNLAAWELLAQVAQDPRQIRYAWQQVLRIDPYHESAFVKLAELEINPPAKNKQSSAGVLVFLVLLIAVMVAVGVVLFLFLQESSPVTVAVPPTLRPTLDLSANENELDMRGAATQAALLISPAAPLPAIWTPTFTPSITFTFTPSITPTSLPPTWTTSPSFTPITPTLTFTPSPTRTKTPTATFPPTETPYPTLNPDLFNQTYWNGVGDGETMETFAQRGRYYRHFNFPINIYFDSNVSSRWQQSITYAINLLSGVVPMRRTLNEGEANIRVYVLGKADYEVACSAHPGSAGCAGLELIRDGATGELQAYGEVFIWVDAPIDTTLTVHEMIHALGVHVHSPNPSDVMYFQYSTESDGLQLTARDRLIIQLLYSLPAVGE